MPQSNLTQAQIDALKTSLIARWNAGLVMSPDDWKKIAKLIKSDGKSNTYEWLSQFPAFREWIGSRQHKVFKETAYTVINRKFESTVDVQRTDIEDDNIGQYGALAEGAGQSATDLKNDLIFQAIAAGFASVCYDGQYFFDTDHPVYPNVDGTGAPAMGINFIDEAGGTPWYLLDTSRVIKPLIFQERTAPELTAMTTTTDEKVFATDTYRYGIRYRCHVGFGFWQTAFCSKKPLTTANFDAAYDAMCAFKADGGRPLGIKPSLLVVPTTLRTKANEVINVSRLANGADNPNAGIVDVLVSPWL